MGMTRVNISWEYYWDHMYVDSQASGQDAVWTLKYSGICHIVPGSTVTEIHIRRTHIATSY
jgi:hypothetical protein